jgi:hypothetical protein
MPAGEHDLLIPSVIPVHGGAGVEGEAQAGSDEAPGRDGHLHRQGVLECREAQGVGVVLDEGRGHLAETSAGR